MNSSYVYVIFHANVRELLEELRKFMYPYVLQWQATFYTTHIFQKDK
jgi:hypothetical protein